MCGIFGAWDPGLKVEEDFLKSLATLQHRGPDHTGFLHEGGVWMGTCRLSIIDLRGGDQPLRNEDGRVSAIFNGEIYNYLELREELRKRGINFGRILIRKFLFISTKNMERIS